MLTGALIGCAVAIAIIVLNRRKAQHGTGLPGQIEQALRGKPPMTLAQVAQLVDKHSFMGRGEVGQALAALQSLGKVRVNPAPAGTPLLKRVELVTYELVARAPEPQPDRPS